MNQILPQRASRPARRKRAYTGKTGQGIRRSPYDNRVLRVGQELPRRQHAVKNVRDFRLYAGLSLWLFQFKESTKPTGVDGVG